MMKSSFRKKYTYAIVSSALVYLNPIYRGGGGGGNDFGQYFHIN